MSDLNEAPKNESVSEEAQPQTWGDLTPDERAMLGAVRAGNPDYAAVTLTRLWLHKGESPASVLQAAIDADDYKVLQAFTKAINAHLNPVKPAWTYERRLALHLIGVMGLEYPGLNDELFSNDDTPSALHSTIDAVADALLDGMHTLGCTNTLDLAHILDYASSFKPRRGDGDDD